MKVGDIVMHNDGTIGIVLETELDGESIFVGEDSWIARVLWSDGEEYDRWYSTCSIRVICEGR
tara:strand:+ start:329 stop:517 length:189 start_codon:yes stop_codon:yes gene_type:complete